MTARTGYATTLAVVPGFLLDVAAEAALPWRDRLHARRTCLRWTVCVTAPWIVVLALEPALGLADHVAGLADGAGPPTLGVLCFVLGLAGAARAASRRGRTLRNALAT